LSKIIFMTIISALVLISLSFSRSGAGFASGSVAGFSVTNVAGPIVANTTWTFAGSPYVVSADVLVIVDVFLTIEPGVVVRFANGTSIIVDGIFIAQGNPSQMITFTSNASSPAPGDWGSIRTRTGGSISNIDWATVEYSGQGIETLSDSIISNCVFRGNNIGVSGSNASIAHCTFDDNINGVNATNTFLTGSEITNNTSGAIGSGSIENTNIWNNSQNGITFSGSVVNCSIYDNGGYGVSANSVTNCSIHDNGGYGVIGNSVANCSIYDNGDYGASGESVTNCSIHDNHGHGISSGSAINCLVYNNGGDGIDGDLATDCIVFNNSMDGIHGSCTNCTIHDNGGAGVSAPALGYENWGSAIDCLVYGNGRYGVAAVLITDSTVFNNKSVGVILGGMRPRGDYYNDGAEMSNCDIHDNLGGGVEIMPQREREHGDIRIFNYTASIEQTHIHNNSFGVLISSIALPHINIFQGPGIRDTIISGCNISQNLQNGIMASTSAVSSVAGISLTALNTIIDSNDGFGISLNTTVTDPSNNATQVVYFPIYEISDCRISNHTIGALGEFGSISGSIIANNSQIGLDVLSINGGINQNNIYGNGLYNIVNHVQFGNDINATQNWWGTTNKTLIEAYIYDYYEDYNLSRVIVEPFLTSSIPEYSSLFALPLFMTAMLLATIGYRKKRTRVHQS